MVDEGPPPARVGRYRVESLVGRGGFGEVFRVSGDGEGDTGPRAAKILRADLVETPDAIARFEREAELLTRLSHPSIVEVYEYGRLDDGRPYLVMELLEGTDLERRLKADGPLAVEPAMTILTAIAEALEVAHAAGVIHRDVKASNVFLVGTQQSPRVVLLDFGIAKLLDPDSVGLTSSRVAIGTPTSMAPEQIRGGPITPRTDVYGLAALAFHMLTGRAPFEDPSATVLQQLHLHARRPRASSFAELPAALDVPLQRGLDCDPQRRPASPMRFVESVRAAIGGPRRDGREHVWACVQVEAVTSDITDDALDRIDRVVADVVALLEGAGFESRAEPGNAVLLAIDAAAAESARDALAAALGSCARAIADAAVPVSLYVRAERDGMDLRWLPGVTRPGVWRWRADDADWQSI